MKLYYYNVHSRSGSEGTYNFKDLILCHADTYLGEQERFRELLNYKLMHFQL